MKHERMLSLASSLKKKQNDKRDEYRI